MYVFVQMTELYRHNYANTEFEYIHWLTYTLCYKCPCGLLFSPDIDTEKNRVTAEIPYGGFLLFSNMIPHRRYVLIFNFQALLPCMDCYKYVLL